MKIKRILFTAFAAAVFFTSCSKSDNNSGSGGTVSIAAKTMLNEPYGVDPLQRMDIYLPANRSTVTTKVMIMIHGGGWTSGDKADFNVWIDTMKTRFPNYAIFNLNYRLAALPSTNPFPTQELDIKAAVEFINGNSSTYLISNKFVLLGASAGGHLSLLQAYKYHSPVNIKAVVDFFGPTDMVDMYNNPGAYPPISIALLLSGTPTSNPTMYFQSSPINFVNSASCPTIIIQGGLDPLVNATTQSLALKNKLAITGIVNEWVFYPTGGHGNWDAATYTDAFNKIQVFLNANVQ